MRVVTVAAALLAAGAGSRFHADGHKLLAPLHGEPVILHALASVLDAGFDQVYVITGAADLADILPASVTLVHAERWADGQAHTLQAAVRAAGHDGHRALVVGLADQPMVPPAAWRSVGAARGEIVTATFDGRRRPPVKLERSVWPLLPIEGDEGARALMEFRPDLVSEIPCLGNPADIDTKEDLARWNSPTTS